MHLRLISFPESRNSHALEPHMLPSQTDFSFPFQWGDFEEDFGAPENMAGDASKPEEDVGLDFLLPPAGQKHEREEIRDSFEGLGDDSTASKRPKLSKTDDDFPFSFADLIPFKYGTPIKEEEDIQTPQIATETKTDTKDQQRFPVTSPSASLRAWADNLGSEDKQAAHQFGQLPTETLVQTMFQIKSRYEQKVRTIVNNLKDDVQFAKDTNGLLVNQLVESNQRETSLSSMLTSALSQLVEKEQSYRSLQDQFAVSQRERDKPQMQWNETKDSIQIDLGVPVSVLTVNWKVIFPATLDNLTFSILDKIMDIKKIWRQSLPMNEITKIEFIMNEDLYVQFKAAKTEFELASRPSTEKIVFHGTAAANINSILTEGFKIGGLDGHASRHGASHVLMPQAARIIGRVTEYIAQQNPIIHWDITRGAAERTIRKKVHESFLRVEHYRA